MIVNSGSFHNFITTYIVRKIGPIGISIGHFVMKVASEENLKRSDFLCEDKCKESRLLLICTYLS